MALLFGSPEKFTGTEMSAALNKIIMCPANENIIAFLGSQRQPYNLCFVPPFLATVQSSLYSLDLGNDNIALIRGEKSSVVGGIKGNRSMEYEYLLMVLFSAALSFDAETDYAFSAKKKEKYKKNK